MYVETAFLCVQGVASSSLTESLFFIPVIDALFLDWSELW